VLVGRPVLDGLAVNGAQGAAHVLRLLLDELAIAMALCGVARLQDRHSRGGGNPGLPSLVLNTGSPGSPPPRG
jgi:hypothetical protein